MLPDMSLIALVNISPRIDQQAYNIILPVCRSQHQRRMAVPVPSLEIGVLAGQELRKLKIAIDGGNHKQSYYR